MTSLNLNEDEALILVELLESAYRRQHREAWEVGRFGDTTCLPSTEKRLQLLGDVLEKLGSSKERALAIDEALQ